MPICWLWSVVQNPLLAYGKEKELKLMASSFTNRHKFITSSLEYTKKFGFDGFDLDWEYPDKDDKDNFSQLLRDGCQISVKDVRIVQKSCRIQKFYPISTEETTLDFVNIMTYDIHGSWENATGFNSPLYDRSNEKLSVE
uniref:GH18 domain-containing protein n=1 Tax=Romanomermis culicivorax TaxID=13658 RepID=A0A915L220_ROMCU